LGRAIAREPKVFLLDEPLSNLDAQLRDDTRAELKQLHQRLGITTIYVTHDQIEAMTLAERIVVLSAGNIQQIGSPQQIYARPANRMVATFIGNPPMNILPATYGNSLFWVGSQSLTCPPVIRERLHPHDGQAFDLGIRPEHIEFQSSSNGANKNKLERDLWALDKVPVEVEVKVVEPLGKETLIRAGLVSTKEGLEGKDLLFQVGADFRCRPGDILTVKLDFDCLFIFDPSSGEAVYP
jgi:multiple sugar transport system ATP-binding protein